MKILISALVAGALGFGAIAATTAPALADNGRNTALAVGGLLGLGVGAAIASQPRYYDEEPRYYHRTGWNAHVDFCMDRFRSYDPRTDTYIGRDGYAHRCYGSY